MIRKILLLLTIFSVAGVCAQTKTTKPATATPAIEEKPNAVEVIMNESDGNITIDIPDTILPSILENPTTGPGSNTPGKTNLKTGINRLTGYRIQVFSDGRDQGTLESRARARGNLILSRFPKYRGQIYTFSNAPNWFTRVGNFRTQEEAVSAMNELKRVFPNFSGEMRVVKSPIVLIK